ncbi:hypothetical protein [Sphingomonas baiyangensis]|uniref:Uncharacterized protein n=1 Tax=Sphingomonas baiyangensis TaxID=2572576 RepID=A0A4U1LA08_9SPHN|nr:hypothetical protein [Sphingomonas baiyangensis]TKD53176.1 hypothetical protein FBR43_02260 [Sphingomonas baiyangensis]
MHSPSAARADMRLFVAALGLCAVLTGGWTLAGWPDLVRLRLPDTDDMMRLVQLRDWIGGQHWRDLTQHRMGADGVAMHWSRLGDLGPLALLLAFGPWLGQAGAERAMVIAWPALLLLAYLLLSARIAMRLGAPAGIAMVLAALAWPATWVFMPGRIDHHGLQIVLLLTMLAATLAPAGVAAGAIAGAAAGASLILGVETAPLLALLLATALFAAWRDPAHERARLLGTGGALLAVTALGAWARPFAWSEGLCDGFTADAARAATVGAGALLGCALVPVRLSAGHRLAAFGAIGVVSLAMLTSTAPACLADPYAALAPELRLRWLSQVGEAQSVFAAPLSTTLAYLGVGMAGLVAACAAAQADRSARWPILALLIGAALLLACHQLRAAHLAAALAPPALAHMVARARAAGTPRTVAAWLASVGIVYAGVGSATAARSDAGSGGACAIEAGIATLAALPPGLVLAPIDLGPAILAETPHRVLAAPYHRNEVGNLAALRALAGERPATATGADYRLDCSGVRALRDEPRREPLAVTSTPD